MTQQQYITDSDGNKISVVVPVKEYKKLIEAWEELSDIKAYDAAKIEKSDPIEANTAFEEIENYLKGAKKK
jgi:phosphoribosylformimino-5-aminoimidazole carboxamide ribonucleotide (ProFAR) isomerase